MTATVPWLLPLPAGRTGLRVLAPHAWATKAPFAVILTARLRSDCGTGLGTDFLPALAVVVLGSVPRRERTPAVKRPTSAAVFTLNSRLFGAGLPALRVELGSVT